LSSKRHIGLRLATSLAASLLIIAAAAAEPASNAGDGTLQTAQAAPEPGAGATTAGAKVQPAPQTSGDAALRQRVEQLEEQLVDMQVMIGTLESLASRGAPQAAPIAAAAPAAGPVDDARIAGLETQVRALAAQIEQLTTQVRALAASPGRTETTVEPNLTTGAAEMPVGSPAEQALTTPGPDRFGSTTVTAGKNDAIGGLLDNETAVPSAPAAEPAAGATGSETVAAAPPAFMPPPVEPQDAANPKQLYETAYGYLMQRDYGAAQSAFEDFLTRYPNDSLAGNAQYWLGEAHFVRGDYKSAAGAFLKGYQDYAGNARAADSLLRLAMSLDRLGQRDAACSSYAELSKRFPDAPENVKLSAREEQKRIGCR
jgi:tol-pal system protein YbgF